MIVGVTYHQPADIIDYDFKVVGIPDGEVDPISTVEASLSPNSPTGLTLVSLKSSDEVAKVWVSDGVDGEYYLVEVTIYLQSGRKKQVEFEVRMEEVN